MSKDKVEIIKTTTGLSIFINGLIHLALPTNVGAIHSYIDSMAKINPIRDCDDRSTNYFTMYYINFYLDSGQMVHCEYNDRELWETILKGM